MVWLFVVGVVSVVGVFLPIVIGVVLGGVVGVVWVVVLGVLGVVVTGGSAFSADVVLFMSVVVCVVVVCEEFVVSVDKSTSSVDEVFCVMLRSACSADVV